AGDRDGGAGGEVGAAAGRAVAAGGGRDGIRAGGGRSAVGAGGGADGGGGVGGADRGPVRREGDVAEGRPGLSGIIFFSVKMHYLWCIKKQAGGDGRDGRPGSLEYSGCGITCRGTSGAGDGRASALPPPEGGSRFQGG